MRTRPYAPHLHRLLGLSRDHRGGIGSAVLSRLGLRIAAARKAAGLTETQLAEQLGLAQQTLAHYEAGRLRVALALLTPLARTLGVSSEELIGEQAPPGKRGPVPKLQQQMERIQRLPKSQQRFVMQMIDTVLAQQDR